ADRENRDQARANAPLAVMALDRLVSVLDYADFARTFAGIGKASAISLPDGRRRVVHLTIAGADDIPIAPTSDLYQNLRLALQHAGDPYQPFVIVTRELMALVIRANVRLHPAYQWESVKPTLEKALYDAFGFERRQLGQDVLLSEVISTMQRVDGVAYVDIDVLDTIAESETENGAKLNAKLARLAGKKDLHLKTITARQLPEKQPRQRIRVQMGRFENGAPKGAQLAILNPDLPQMLDLKELPQ
ncbi:MAG: putative baseplate assembly protein, partial [Bacteroidetes bacterium]